VRYLPPEQELVYLSAHCAQHLFQRASWLYDLKLFVRARPGLSYERVAEIAGGADMRAATHAALVLAAEVLGAAVPRSALERVAPSRAHAGLVLRAFTPERLASGVIAASAAAPALRALLADSPARAARHLAQGAVRRIKRAVRSRSAR
jgi:hypothetical protein